MFLQMSVCPRGGLHGRGACMVGCMAGGVHCGRVCVVEGCARHCGHAWQGGACMAGGHTWHAHPPGRYYEIRSMSGRYASYWNAFLLAPLKVITFLFLQKVEYMACLDLITQDTLKGKLFFLLCFFFHSIKEYLQREELVMYCEAGTALER